MRILWYLDSSEILTNLFQFEGSSNLPVSPTDLALELGCSHCFEICSGGLHCDCSFGLCCGNLSSDCESFCPQI